MLFDIPFCHVRSDRNAVSDCDIYLTVGVFHSDSTNIVQMVKCRTGWDRVSSTAYVTYSSHSDTVRTQILNWSQSSWFMKINLDCMQSPAKTLQCQVQLWFGTTVPWAVQFLGGFRTTPGLLFPFKHRLCPSNLQLLLTLAVRNHTYCVDLWTFGRSLSRTTEIAWMYECLAGVQQKLHILHGFMKAWQKCVRPTAGKDTLCVLHIMRWWPYTHLYLPSPPPPPPLLSQVVSISPYHCMPTAGCPLPNWVAVNVQNGCAHYGGLQLNLKVHSIGVSRCSFNYTEVPSAAGLPVWIHIEWLRYIVHAIF